MRRSAFACAYRFSREARSQSRASGLLVWVERSDERCRSVVTGPQPTLKSVRLPSVHRTLARTASVSARQVVVAVVGLTAVGGVLELSCPAVRSFAVQHPFLVGVVLVGLTVFGVERAIGLQESRRWRKPALGAIETYMYSADRATQVVQTRILEQTRSLPRAPVHEPRLREGLEQLADQDPSRLRTLADDARREADAAGQVAMAAFSTIARHEPLENFIERITEVQGRLGDLADLFNGLSFMAAGLGGEKDATFRELIGEKAQVAEGGLFAISHLLGEMRLQLEDLRGQR